MKKLKQKQPKLSKETIKALESVMREMKEIPISFFAENRRIMAEYDCLCGTTHKTDVSLWVKVNIRRKSTDKIIPLNIADNMCGYSIMEQWTDEIASTIMSIIMTNHIEIDDWMD